MYDIELVEIKKKVDVLLAPKTKEFQQGITYALDTLYAKCIDKADRDEKVELRVLRKIIAEMIHD